MGPNLNSQRFDFLHLKDNAIGYLFGFLSMRKMMHWRRNSIRSMKTSTNCTREHQAPVMKMRAWKRVSHRSTRQHRASTRRTIITKTRISYWVWSTSSTKNCIIYWISIRDSTSLCIHINANMKAYFKQAKRHFLSTMSSNWQRASYSTSITSKKMIIHSLLTTRRTTTYHTVRMIGHDVGFYLALGFPTRFHSIQLGIGPQVFLYLLYRLWNFAHEPTGVVLWDTKRDSIFGKTAWVYQEIEYSKEKSSLKILKDIQLWSDPIMCLYRNVWAFQLNAINCDWHFSRSCRTGLLRCLIHIDPEKLGQYQNSHKILREIYRLFYWWERSGFKSVLIWWQQLQGLKTVWSDGTWLFKCVTHYFYR